MVAGTFKLLSERKLSTLSPEQRKIWAKLVARRKRIEDQLESLEEEEAFFVDGVLMDVVQENHRAVRGVRVSDEGFVFQVYCECYRCQAHLQQLPPTFVVEQMAQQELIEEADVPEARKWAKAMEQKHGRPVLN